MRPQISFHGFCRNSVSKLLNQRNGFTLCGDFPHLNAVSRTASFKFFSEPISHSTGGLIALPNTPSRIPQKLCFRHAPSKDKFNDVRRMQTSQSGFSQSFFPSPFLKTLPLSLSASTSSYRSLCRFYKDIFQTAQSKEHFNPVR